MGRLGLDIRVSAVGFGDGKANGVGCEGAPAGAVFLQGLQNLFRSRLERVDPQIDRRSLRQRAPLRRAAAEKDTREGRIEPLLDSRRRSTAVLPVQRTRKPCAFSAVRAPGTVLASALMSAMRVNDTRHESA